MTTQRGDGATALGPVTARNLARLVEASSEVAVFLGLDTQPAGLPPMDPSSIAHKLQVYRDWMAELKALDVSHLSPSARFDIRAFAGHLSLYRYVIQDLARWRHNPDVVSSLGELCFILLVRPRETEEQRFAELLAKLEGVPAYLDGARSRLGTLDAVWADTADRVCLRMEGLWTSVAGAARRSVGGALADEIAAAAARAGEAVEAYRRWLSDVPNREEGLWILGDDRFAELVSLKGLGLDVDDIREIGEYYLAHLRDKRRMLARSLCGSDDVAVARRRARRPVPESFEHALEQIRGVASESRTFLETHALVPLPEGEELAVMQTPDFLAPLIPFAAMMEAGVYETQQRSVYMVTPPESGDLSDLALTRFAGIAVHEGYPGHHLQHAHAHRNTSVYRNNPFTGFPADGSARYGLDLVEGWAHYCEEMMKNHGFHDSLESRFLMVEDQLFRAVRILIDVDLSRGRMQMAEAEQMLMSEVGVPEPAARAEVRRYTTSPTYQMCYLLGKHKIEEFRKEVHTLLGAGFDDLEFHRLILDAGCVPVEMIRESFLATLPSGDA